MWTSLIRHHSIGWISSKSNWQMYSAQKGLEGFWIRSDPVHMSQLTKAHRVQYLCFGHGLQEKANTLVVVAKLQTHLQCFSSHCRPFRYSTQAPTRTVYNNLPFFIKLYLWGLSVKVLNTNISHNICACCAASVHHEIWHGVKLALPDHAEYNLVSLRQLKAPPSAVLCRINIRAH